MPVGDILILIFIIVVILVVVIVISAGIRVLLEEMIEMAQVFYKNMRVAIKNYFKKTH